jgi:hypothetical protein
MFGMVVIGQRRLDRGLSMLEGIGETHVAAQFGFQVTGDKREGHLITSL